MTLRNRQNRPSIIKLLSKQKQVVLNVIGNKAIKDDETLQHTV